MFFKVFRQIKLAVLIGLVTALPSQVFGIGLGEIQLNTPLNEPLNAEIKLLQVQNLNEDEILVGIAPKADFEAAGVDRLFFLSSLKFSLELDNPKGPLIRIKTDAPVREPYLNFLLEVEWPNGRLLREYTLLMDLPAFSESGAVARPIKGTEVSTSTSDAALNPAPLDVNALEAELAAVDAVAVPTVVPVQESIPVTASSSVAESEMSVSAAPEPAAESNPEPEAQKAAATEESLVSAEEPAQSEAAASAQPAPAYEYQQAVPVYATQSGEGDYVVQPGDNLWNIAMKYRRDDGVSIQQSILAIQRLNPEAFIEGNINKLKKGKVLQLPSYEQLTEMTSREALAEVRRQNMEWSGDPNGIKSAPSFEQIDATRQDVAAVETPVEVEDGHLKLSVPGAADDSASGKASGSEAGSVEALQNELAISMEELDRNKRERSQVGEQIASLDEQSKTMQQMLEVRSAELAALQNALANKDQVSTELPSDGAAVEAATDQVAEPSVEVTPVSEEVPQAGGGLLGMLKDNLIIILGGLLTVVALVFAAMKLRNRKSTAKATDSDLEESDNAGEVEDFVEEETALDDLDDVADSLEGSFEPEAKVERSTADTKAETGDVIGEADIYISFGTYDKAESLLKNAISAEPKRTDLRMKLLEVYVGMDDLGAFDRQYAELSSMKDPGAVERAAELRNRISGAASSRAPGVSSAVSANVADDTADFDLDLNLDDVSVDDSISKAEESLDFDLDFDEPLPESTQKSASVSISDAPTVQQRALDINEMNTAVSPAVKVSEARTELRESIDLDLSGLDTSLDSFDAIGQESEAAKQKSSSQPSTPVADTGLDEEFDFLADADESATKLDLARAYIDMGDKDGAKDILQEVIEEGQEAQKAEARKLLEGIS